MNWSLSKSLSGCVYGHLVIGHWSFGHLVISDQIMILMFNAARFGPI